jgi:hypothetical protein
VLHASQQRREGVGAEGDLARADTAEGVVAMIPTPSCSMLVTLVSS